ncbi:MAG: hypothetical protein ACQESF_02380 [Nanobdellota archaeon]
MKRRLTFLIPVVLFLLVSVSVYASDETELKEIINDYYKASVSENLDMYLDLFEYGKQQREASSIVVEKLWDSFDIVEYSLEFNEISCSIDKRICLVNYQADVKVMDKKGNVKSVSNIFIAEFEDTQSGYKLFSVDYKDEYSKDLSYEFNAFNKLGEIVQKENINSFESFLARKAYEKSVEYESMSAARKKQLAESNPAMLKSIEQYKHEYSDKENEKSNFSFVTFILILVVVCVLIFLAIIVGLVVYLLNYSKKSSNKTPESKMLKGKKRSNLKK